MASSNPGAAPNQPPRRFWDRPVLLAGLAMTAVFGIVLTVSLAIGRNDARPTPDAVSTADTKSDALASDPAAGDSVAPAAGDPTPAKVPAAPPAPAAVLGRPITAAAAAAPLRAYSDARDGFEAIVDTSWRVVTVQDGAAPPPAPAYSVMFGQSGTGARMAISRWRVAAAVPLERWAADVAGGLASVNGRTPTNAMVAGSAALLLWAPESPTVPARYEALLRRGDRVYGVAYAAYDGGAAMQSFVRLLVTLEWPGAGGAARPTVDLIPPLLPPAARFFPSARFFAGGGSG